MSGWHTYWKANGVHRSHASHVEGCIYCAEARADLVARVGLCACGQPCSPLTPGVCSLLHAEFPPQAAA